MEIAEILDIPRASVPEQLSGFGALDYLVVPDVIEPYRAEIDRLETLGTRVVSQAQVLELLRRTDSRPPRTPAPPGGGFSIDDALAAFERLFDREALLDFLLDVAVKAADARAGSIMLYSEEADELYIVHATGLSERVVRNTRQRLGEGIAGIVARDRKGKLIKQSGDQTLYSHDRDRSDIRSAISVPLVYEEHLLGVLNVSAGERAPELTHAGLHKLERLAPRIARVLNESLKLQEARMRHQEMSLRRSVGELGEHAMSPRAKFSVVSNYLSELVGADTVEVYIGTHEGDWLVLGGSNRRLATTSELVRGDRGALSRAYLDGRTVILTESSSPTDRTALLTSFVFAPLKLNVNMGVLMLEFGERHRLDEFLAIKDSIVLELSRFIASEKREHRLKREATALGVISDGAPLLLTCRTMEDLCDYVARLVADALDCERVSVRMRAPGTEETTVARYEAGARSDAWPEEDHERYRKLEKKQTAYRLAFLDVPRDAETTTPSYHSLVGVPVMVGGAFAGGVIAYDRRPATAFEDATFTDLDRELLEHAVALAVPVAESIARSGALPEGQPAAAGEPSPSYETVLSGNLQRLRKVLDTEMARADRYHESFSLLVFRVKPLDTMFRTDPESALRFVDEVTKGIQTRTRKTDFGAWIRHDTFAMLSLEGTKRVRFLVSRLLLYLLKDFATVAGRAIERSDFHVGHSLYPGEARTPEAMIAEAEGNAAPHDGE